MIELSLIDDLFVLSTYAGLILGISSIVYCWHLLKVDTWYTWLLAIINLIAGSFTSFTAFNIIRGAWPVAYPQIGLVVLLLLNGAYIIYYYQNH